MPPTRREHALQKRARKPYLLVVVVLAVLFGGSIPIAAAVSRRHDAKPTAHPRGMILGSSWRRRGSWVLPKSTHSPSASDSAASTGCAARPSGCGYPDASNTGPVSGTRLYAVPEERTQGPGWYWDSRGWIEVNGDGAVLDGVIADGGVEITGKDATVRNSVFTVGGEGFGISVRDTSGATIEDSIVKAPSASGPKRLLLGIYSIDSTGTSVLRTEITGASTGILMEDGLIQGNYIHDLGYKDGDHVNGITSNGGTRLLEIRHNTVFNQYDQTDAISLFQDFDVQQNRIIADNLMAGGGYTLYAGANAGKESGATSITVTGNRFSKLYYPRGGYFGPVTAFYKGGGNIWSGNIWDGTGLAVNP